MSEVKRYWENEYEYKRILEILDDYWLTSKDEVRVVVEMHFLKGNGEYQTKQIDWSSPLTKKTFSDEGNIDYTNIELPTMAEFEESSLDRFWNEQVRLSDSRHNRIPRTDVYARYEEFCKGEQIVPESRNSLYGFMRGKKVVETRSHGDRYFNGITLRKGNAKNEKEEEKVIMEDIVWFNKDRSGWVQKKCDVSINKLKDGCINIVVRNGWHDEITKTGYMRIGLSSNSKNKLFFMAADASCGWKLGRASKAVANYNVKIKDERVVDGLVRFIGDYEMEVSEDNLCYIDRKNALE